MAAPNLPLLRLASLEVPDCGCARVEMPACVRATGERCHDFYAPLEKEHGPRGGCDCPIVPGTPCPHVYLAEDGFWTRPWAEGLMEDASDKGKNELAARWAARLRAASPDEYSDPPQPPDIMLCHLVDERVATMANRWGDDPNRPRYAIWLEPRTVVRRDARGREHKITIPGDLTKGADCLVSTERRRADNGSDREVGLKIYDPDAPGETPDPIWGDFALARLELANEIVARLAREKVSRAA